MTTTNTMTTKQTYAMIARDSTETELYLTKIFTDDVLDAPLAGVQFVARATLFAREQLGSSAGTVVLATDAMSHIREPNLIGTWSWDGKAITEWTTANGRGGMTLFED